MPGIKYLISKYGGGSSIEKIPIKDLYVTRPFLREDKLLNAEKGIPSRRPQIIEVLGKRFIHDGHHRIADAITKGEKEIEVILLRSKSQRLYSQLLRKSGEKQIDQIY